MPIEPQRYNTQNGVTGGVWRDGDVVIKRLRHTAPGSAWTPSADERHWLYWRREADAYATGLPARVGLRGPRLVESTDVADGVELRVEAFDGRTAAELTVDDLAELARQLGRGQGRDDQPSDTWLSRGFLRDYSRREIADHSLYENERMWEHDLVAPYVDDALRRDLVALHANSDRLLAIAEALPRTVCHLDLFPANIFATDSGLGVIDWAFTGDGAVGEDIGNLIPDSVFDRDLHVSLLPELEERLITAYLEGLRDAGWSGDDRLAVLGVHASSVKYDWLGPRVLLRAGQAEHTQYGGAPTNPQELYAARWAGLRLVCRWATEALAEAERLRL